AHPSPYQEEEVFANDGRLSACGPVSCYTALVALGVQASIENIENQLDWRPGRQVSLERIYCMLQQYPGVCCEATNLDLGELEKLVESDSCVALVPIRRFGTEIDHIVTVVGTRDERFLVMDFPDEARFRTCEEMKGVWTGSAIIVRREGPLPKGIWTNRIALSAVCAVGAALLAIARARSGS
ncbi:MAG TPA: hypothetical protein PKY01_12630, partial [Candidatus Hydrogenedentes bacterium]|nr:hypothetical protein [Candidatus Hydrogenedentota bacterium]